MYYILLRISILCIDSCNTIAKATFDLQSSLVFKKRRKLQLLLPLSLALTLIARNLVIARVFKCIYTAFGLESEARSSRVLKNN